jgi:hypothetical protein
MVARIARAGIEWGLFDMDLVRVLQWLRNDVQTNDRLRRNVGHNPACAPALPLFQPMSKSGTTLRL